MATTPKPSQVDPKLLEILRCPVAVHYTDKGDDPGQLESVRDGHWLYCEDSGYKYPVIDGIPKMLIEEGAKWQDTDIDELPVPPPNDPVYAVAEEALPPEMQKLVDDLSERAQETRQKAVQQLRDAAQAIRKDAEESGSGTAAVRASDIADTLDQAAAAVSGQQTASPAPSEGLPWKRILAVFVVGLIAGMFLRGKRQ